MHILWLKRVVGVIGIRRMSRVSQVRYGSRMVASIWDMWVTDLYYRMCIPYMT